MLHREKSLHEAPKPKEKKTKEKEMLCPKDSEAKPSQTIKPSVHFAEEEEVIRNRNIFIDPDSGI